jgi:hypothetical protein
MSTTPVLEARPMASRPEVGLVKSQTEVKNQHGDVVLSMNGWGMFPAARRRRRRHHDDHGQRVARGAGSESLSPDRPESDMTSITRRAALESLAGLAAVAGLPGPVRAAASMQSWPLGTPRRTGIHDVAPGARWWRLVHRAAQRRSRLVRSEVRPHRARSRSAPARRRTA